MATRSKEVFLLTVVTATPEVCKVSAHRHAAIANVVKLCGGLRVKPGVFDSDGGDFVVVKYNGGYFSKDECTTVAAYLQGVADAVSMYEV